MYPILILRAEVVCLVILFFLRFTSRAYKVDRDTKSFRYLLFFAILHVCFDFITVLTVNNMDIVPLWLNTACHIVFYLSAIFYSCEIESYVFNICYPKYSKVNNIVIHSLATLYVLLIPILKIKYEEDYGTFTSTGLAAYVGYGLGFAFFIGALVLIFVNLNKMSGPVKKVLIPTMFVLIIFEISQIIIRSLLLTGCAITIVTVGFFFSLENPNQIFKRKNMVDALTGVQSRNSYESDIQLFNKNFTAKPNDSYTFVFCDINGLKSINDRYGHNEGDNCIMQIASAINSSMQKASRVYRIGGDEFLILYIDTDETIVKEEIQKLHKACAKASEGQKYYISVSAGYARSSKQYKNLKDVVKIADFAMYQSKSKFKASNSLEKNDFGTTLNYSGLTDKIFDAMCSSNDMSYPFITNLETNVTRISPQWKNYFGLDQEFIEDFNSIWAEHVHPDYLTDYLKDFASTINGHQKNHNITYYAKNANGEYVRVSCHGSVYRDENDSCSYFSGFLVNHGIEDHIDKITGLPDYESLNALACKLVDQKTSFSTLKIRINNYARVNILYGYNGGDEIIKRIAELLVDELGEKGEVFCQSGVNFTIILFGNDKDQIEQYYKNISQKLANGINTEVGTVPLTISGGAVMNNGDNTNLQDMRRSLVYALEESFYSNRNKLVFHSITNTESRESDYALISDIHSDAMADIQFFKLRYQPIIDLKTKKTIGAEALLRWVHPIEGEIPPGKFISFIESDPCYYRLGLWIIENAVRDAKEIQKIIPNFKINVNITALQLQDDNFPTQVLEILDKYQFDSHCLILELTERCKEMDGEFLAKKIEYIRNHGILVAFDDLGTGYSTISILMDIPVDEVKLDKDFVVEMQQRKSYQLFVRSLVLGATTQGHSFTICFEGIETKEMMEFVAKFGNHLAQGYYFSKPLFFQDFIAYIENAQ